MNQTISNMSEMILRLEKQEGVRVLYAVEASSRAWGFPSANSDHDVRCIYVHPIKRYLSLDGATNTCRINEGDWEVVGWDLRKALHSLRKGDPTMLEWVNSWIVYHEAPYFCSGFIPLVRKYWNPRVAYMSCRGRAFNKPPTLYEISLGRLKDYSSAVLAKRYLHSLRFLLASRWIADKGTPPPWVLSELITSILPYGPVRESGLNLIAARGNGSEEGFDFSHLTSFFNEEWVKPFPDNFALSTMNGHEDLDDFFRACLDRFGKTYEQH